MLNRAVGRGVLFEDQADYLSMERVIDRTRALLPIRIVSYCLMRTHWHFVLWPVRDGQLSEFMRLLTVIRERRGNGESFASIADGLNQAGQRTSRDSEWTPMAVKRVIDRAAAPVA